MDSDDELDNSLEREVHLIGEQLDGLKRIDDRLAQFSDRLGEIRIGIFVLIGLALLGMSERAAKIVDSLFLWLAILVVIIAAIFYLIVFDEWLKEKWFLFRVQRASKKNRELLAKLDRKHGTPAGAQPAPRH